MVVSEDLNVFTVFKAEGSGGMLTLEKLLFLGILEGRLHMIVAVITTPTFK